MFRFFALSALIYQLIPVAILPPLPSGITATPGFVSVSAKNSLLTVAVGTSGGAGMVSAATCASYSYCFPFAETSLSGNLAIVPFQYANGGTPVTATATDDKSDSYTCIGSSAEDGSTGKYLNLCYYANLPGTTATNGAHRVSVTFGTTAVTQVTAQAAMFYNIATTSPLRTSGTQVGTSSTTMTGPSVSTSANDLVYAYFCRTGTPVMTSASFTAGSGFTLALTQYQDGCASEFKVSSGGSITPTMTMGSASTYIVFAAVFEASSGAAGTVPSNPYLKRVMSWGSASSVSTSTFTFQLPNESGDLLVSTTGGAVNYAANSITDSGSNIWTLANQCLQAGGCATSAGYSSEFYVQNAGSNTTNTQTVNLTGTGDVTIFLYDFAGMPTQSYTNTGSFGTHTTSTTLLPATAFSYVPYATSFLTVAEGQIAFNTAVSVASPSSSISNYFDAGYYGGMTLDGGSVPESVIDQNNIWSHSYQTSTVGVQSWQWNTDTNVSQSNSVGADLLAFMTSGSIGIVNNKTASCQSSCTTFLTFTIPATTSGNLLVVSTGWSDGSTIRTVSKICTGNSTTCASGSQFTVVTGAVSTQTSSIFGNAIWSLLSAPAGATQITVVYSGTTSASGSEDMYYEVAKASGGSWAVDPVGGGAHVNAGASCTTTCTGAAVTTVGTLDFCAAHFSTSGTGVTANPKSGNAYIYAGTGATNFWTGDAATSLLTLTASAHTPVWQSASGTFNAVTACFD
jgi:hypothetical protein